MKVAIIGSRSLCIDISGHIPANTTEIISGGAMGIDRCARHYANANGIKLTEFLPEYNKYGRVAPLRRNELIVNAADIVIAFWDGDSRGTKYTINCARRAGKEVSIIRVNRNLIHPDPAF